MPSVRAAAALLWAVAAGPAHAAGIDCDRARLPAEQSICADPALLKRDAEVAALYARATRRGARSRDFTVAVQRGWLASRNACLADASCLSAALDERIQQLKRQEAYRPDATDVSALAELHRRVAALSQPTGEFALSQALEAVAVESLGMRSTTFSNEVSAAQPDTDPVFPVRRPGGVTADEWRALRRSGVEGGGENGVARYTLLDVDGDGRRDLIVDTYIGGTGLFNHVSVLMRRGAAFEGKAYSRDADEGVEVLYSINGRGSNQTAQWVRLAGRVYAAHVDGSYGEDLVHLLRPGRDSALAPSLTVRYAYQLSMDRQQSVHEPTSRTFVLDAARHAALLAALAKAPATAEAATAAAAARSAPVCPVPEGVSEDIRSRYEGIGPLHYSVESVAEFPVWLGAQCQPAQLIDWFGRYDGAGLMAQLVVRDPLTDDDQWLQVQGRRRVLSVTRSISGEFRAR